MSLYDLSRPPCRIGGERAGRRAQPIWRRWLTVDPTGSPAGRRPSAPLPTSLYRPGLCSERLRAQETAQILADGQSIHTAPLLHERPDPAVAEAESNAEAVAHITTVLQELARTHRRETVVAVSHGYVMRTLLVALGFATIGELPKDALTHTGYMQLSSDGEQLTLAEVFGVHKTGGKQ